MNLLSTRQNQQSSLYAGVMTGTSLDGLDAVLADFSKPDSPHVLASVSLEYPSTLRTEMLALQAGSDGTRINELHRSRIAGIALANLHIQALQQLFAHDTYKSVAAAIGSYKIAGIGVHGQTVRHAPCGIAGSPAYTVQLIDAPRIVEALGCTVVSDFRSRDIAAGGQGAPLVPAFHAAICANLPKPVALCNIGGFANLTLLNLNNANPNPTHIQGLDTGPGNVLMDMWTQQHLNKPYDADGAWAKSGTIHHILLTRLLAHPYFSQPLPKSTGREAFDINWLNMELQGLTVSPTDIQTTLCELTASSIAQAIQQHFPVCKALYICGGGALNHYLMQRLSALLQGCSIHSTTALGINPQHMEALAFAWLARQCLLGFTGNIPSVTGAAGLRVLGQICPA